MLFEFFYLLPFTDEEAKKMPPLQIIILTLTIGTLFITSIPRTDKQGVRIVALLLSIYIFLMFVILFYYFDTKQTGYQFCFEILLIPQYGLNLSFGVDSYSLAFSLLTAYIMPICIYASENIEKNYKQFIIYLLLIELCILLTFLVKNAFFFYIFFESVLIPMYFLIGQ
jgi:NADH-quinone oxidoreductase subunit M